MKVSQSWRPSGSISDSKLVSHTRLQIPQPEPQTRAPPPGFRFESANRTVAQGRSAHLSQFDNISTRTHRRCDRTCRFQGGGRPAHWDTCGEVEAVRAVSGTRILNQQLSQAGSRPRIWRENVETLGEDASHTHTHSGDAGRKAGVCALTRSTSDRLQSESWTAKRFPRSISHTRCPGRGCLEGQRDTLSTNTHSHTHAAPKVKALTHPPL